MGGFTRGQGVRTCGWNIGLKASSREFSGTDDEGLAKASLQRRIAEKKAALAGLMGFTGPQRTTVEDLIGWLLDDYRIRQRRSLPDTNYHLQAVRRLLGDCLASDITGAKLRWYVACRLDEGKANATINRELAALRRAFNLTYQDGQVKVVPAFPTPEANPVPGPLRVWRPGAVTLAWEGESSDTRLTARSGSSTV
jgi:hypothetical protein